MKKLLNLAFLLCITSGIYAQFSSSESVYYYEYQYTIDDGIKSQSQPEYAQIYVFNFQNNMMGRAWGSKKDIRNRMVNDSEYYAKEARNDLGDSYRRWKKEPQTYTDINFVPSIFMYNSNTSTSSKYTYQLARRTWAGALGTGWHWTGFNWGNGCYSFSTNMQELIIWSTDNETRHYYKLIDKKSLQRNLDFLN